MARIILSCYMMRRPVGGIISWNLQYLLGFQMLGHEIYLVEKSYYPNSCVDPSKNIASDDCSYGIKTVSSLLVQFSLGNHWCYVDTSGRYHGLTRRKIREIFKTADLFIEMGDGGHFFDPWLDETRDIPLRVLLEPEPSSSQIKMEKRLANGNALPKYDFYYTPGRNIGTDKSISPTGSRQWHHIFPPILLDLYPLQNVKNNSAFTTVMVWDQHGPIEFNGVTYGAKDVEFAKFMELPRLTSSAMEVAVSGKKVPIESLKKAGWRVRDANQISSSFDSYRSYIQSSYGEFSVAKNIFVATKCGWFSERSAAYLASGRPVVLQDTGYSSHLPCGKGLFAVNTAEEAATAIDEISANYKRHAGWAREIAVEYLAAQKVLGRFLEELGI